MNWPSRLSTRLRALARPAPRRELFRATVEALRVEFSSPPEPAIERKLEGLRAAHEREGPESPDAWLRFARWASCHHPTPSVLEAALRVAPGDGFVEMEVLRHEEALRSPWVRRQLLQSPHPEVLVRALDFAEGEIFRETFLRLLDLSPALTVAGFQSPRWPEPLPLRRSDLATLLGSPDGRLRLEAIRLSATCLPDEEPRQAAPEASSPDPLTRLLGRRR